MSLLYGRFASQLRGIAARMTSEHYRLRLLAMARQWEGIGNDRTRGTAGT